MSHAATQNPDDLYILSDLHLGAGRSPKSHRYSRLETFFYDEEYANFIDRVLVETMARRSSARLILNGDIFDFLAMTELPDQKRAREFGLRIQRDEHKYGLGTSEMKSSWKMERILAGHPVFCRALLRFVGAGNKVTITRGNHDVELFWPGVRQRFFTVLADQANRAGLAHLNEDTLRERIEFEQWFYYEPGRVYVEHGHQYEPSNSCRFNLNPVLPAEFSAGQRVLDYPTGSLFVRFLFNKMRLVDPFTTYFVTVDRYMWLIGRASFLDLLRSVTLHFPFFLKAIRVARFFELHGMEEVAAVHEEALEDVATQKNLDVETVRALDNLMMEPIGKTKYSLVQEVLRPVVRSSLTVVGIALLSLSIWFALFTLIHSTGWIAKGVIMKAGLLAILSALTVAGLFFLFMTLHRRFREPGTSRWDTYFHKAEQIAALMDVPIVSMGHTHATDLKPFRERDGFYANSGTWVLTTGPWDVVKPKSRQFTFVRIIGQNVELLRWDDPRSRWEHVALMEDYDPSPLERLIRDEDPFSE